MYKGMGTAMSLNTVELETVKAGDGNWAEYQWVKEQLRNARLQRGRDNRSRRRISQAADDRPRREYANHRRPHAPAPNPRPPN
jgi:hypothetical protein